MENTALQTIQESGLQIAEVQRIIGEAPATLQDNKKRTANALEFADNLIKNSQEAGMSDTLDSQMADYVDKGKKTLTAINERRKPFTQMVDYLKKEFTGLESTLKAKVDEVQAIRNTYATRKMEEQRERERQAQLKLAQEKEAIELKQQAETKLAEAFAEHLKEAKQLMLDRFNGATLDTLYDVCLGIKECNETLTRETYATFRPKLSAQYHAAADIAVITSAAMNAAYFGHCTKYTAEMATLKRELMDKKASKEAELRALAAADAQERERLEAERIQREAEEKRRLELEAAEAKAKAEAEAAVAAAGATAGAIVDAQAEVAAIAPDVKEGYEIIIKNVAANLLISQLWFEQEGKRLSQDKIDKITFTRMRKFCEAYALKTGECILSPMLEYKPVYKAK